MFKKWMILAALLLLTTTAQADVSDDHAHLRFMPLADNVQSVSVTLQDGRTVLSNLTTGAISDYLEMEVNRSGLIIIGITPTRGASSFREWSIPPLAPGYYTAALVGSSTDSTLNLIFINENDLCRDEPTCLIVVNNVKGLTPLSLVDGADTLVDDIEYRQAVASPVAPATYYEFATVERINPTNVIFPPQTKFFEPNTIYLYGLSGGMGTDYGMSVARRVTTDIMTFLRGLTADVQLTDGEILFAAENIVEVLEQSGYDTLLSNPYLDLTIFAPTDAAILDAVPELFGCATANPDAMQALILNHIVIGGRTPAELIDAQMLVTMGGEAHTFAPAANSGYLIDNQVFVEDSLAYPAENGMVYLVDSVLVPEGFVEQYCEAG